MSLLHRVSSLDSFSSARNRRSSSVPRDSIDAVAGWESPRQRKLSYSPIPPSWDPQRAEADVLEVSAVDVPKYKRVLQICVAVIYCLFAAGIVFGYAAIKPVLIAEGILQLCLEEELC